MLNPVSTTIGICWLGHAAMNAYARPGSAISAEANAVAQAASALVRASERSQALFGDKSVAISQLLAIANECAEPDWDGNAASMIDPAAVLGAHEFVRALPGNVPLPEFAPEPDGSISLDWVKSRHRVLTISIGGSHRLAYAWHDGAEKGHGVAVFDRTTIPPRVLQEIRIIVGH